MPDIKEQPKEERNGGQQFTSSALTDTISPILTDMTMQNVRMVDGHNLFNLPVYGEEDDPEKKSCPTGGCPDDKKLYTDIYFDMLDATAKENHLDLKDRAQRRIAHFNILSLFRTRVRENNNYKQQDREGPPSALGPEFTIVDGHIYYPKFAKTLLQMYEDQRRLRPDKFDAREYATMLLIEQAFRNGATRVSHVSHNRDKDGKVAIRDQITMVIDPVTGIGRMEITNIAAESGRDFSLKEAFDAMNNGSNSFIEGHPKEGVFIFTDAPIESTRVHEILSVLDLKNVRSDQQNADIRHDVYQIATDVGMRPDVAVVPIHDREEAVQIPIFLQKLLDVSPRDQNQPEFLFSAEDTLKKILTAEGKNSVLLALTETPKDVDARNSGEDDISALWRRLAEKVLGISSKQSEQLLGELQKTSQAMHDAQEIVAFVAKTDVAIAAGLYALNILTLSEQPDENLSLVSEFVLSREQHTETGSLEFISQLPQEKKDLIFSFFLQMPAENYLIDMQKVLPEEFDVDVFIQTIDFIRAIDTLPPDEKEIAILREKEKTLMEIIFLWDHLAEILHHKNEGGHEGTSVTIHSPRELIPAAGTSEISTKQENEHVEDFSFAIVVWMLLKMSGYYANLEFVHSFVAKRDKNPLMYLIGKEKPIGLIQKEPAPWLLFAIIWHLSMIREQGTAQSQQQNIKRAKPKQAKILSLTNSNFAEHGVIFAFTPAPDPQSGSVRGFAINNHVFEAQFVI